MALEIRDHHQLAGSDYHADDGDDDDDEAAQFQS
jgi:hypothetical protein